MQAQPLIAVRDVAASSRWYQAVLGCTSGHGGTVYERLESDGTLVLQLHCWNDGSDDHPNLDGGAKRVGRGVLLWFHTDDFDAAVVRVRRIGAEIVEEPHVSSSAGHREVWLRDLDGYHVVIAGPANV
jgi:catechol 2,3-dioxygenase-like lactoylglutathione lyase family enzyme